jgi:hypothetical protein
VKVEAKSDPIEIEASINDIKQKMSGIIGISAIELEGAAEESSNKSIGRLPFFLLHSIGFVPVTDLKKRCQCFLL